MKPCKVIDLVRCFCGTATGIVILALVTLAHADEGPLHKHPPQHEKLHQEFYKDWKQPPHRSRSCCNDKDCYPTPIKFEDGNHWALRREDQKWIKIDPLVLEQNQEPDDQRESPDFQSHACISSPDYDDGFDYVYCATIGGAN